MSDDIRKPSTSADGDLGSPPEPVPAGSRVLTEQDAERRSKGCYLSPLELHELDEACAPFLSAFGEQ